jgi:hypothetical protein
VGFSDVLVINFEGEYDLEVSDADSLGQFGWIWSRETPSQV